MKNLQTLPDVVKKNPEACAQWYQRHMRAVDFPKGLESPIVHGIRAWLAYSDQVTILYTQEIGKDWILGEHWKDWGLALRGLLNGDCGRLDCGTLDWIICDNLHEQGFKGWE